jgi:hypothetical protein
MMYSSIDRLQKLGLASVLCLSIFVPGRVMAQTMNASSDETLLRQMVLRLAGAQAQILLRQLPSQLPVELPMPEQADLIGSLTSPYGQQNSYIIMLDVPQSIEQVQAYYRQALQSAGWRENSGFYFRTIGFVSSIAMPETLIFCNSAYEVQLSADRLSETPAITTVYLVLNSAQTGSSVCTTRAQSSPYRIEDSIPLPVLTPPADAQVNANVSGGGSDTEWSSKAEIVSSMDSQALATHYLRQLVQAGWTQQSSETNGSITWSFLTLRDDQGQIWQGFLTIAGLEEANQYAASVIVLRQ